GDDAAANCRLMKSELTGVDGVLSLTASDHVPARKTNRYHALTTSSEKEPDSYYFTKGYSVDHDFLDHFGLGITQGSAFPRDVSDGDSRLAIITESTAEVMGIQEPVGSFVYTNGQGYEIVGVVADFQGSTMSLANAGMAFIRLAPDRAKSLVLKLDDRDVGATLDRVRGVWQTTLPTTPFVYSFLEDDIAESYSVFRNMGNIMAVLAMVTIGMACLGIYALVSYAAAQRTRELGIRKVLGASVSGIVALLAKEFVVLIVIANVIAAPLAWVGMQGWMRNFSVQVGFGVDIFVIAGLTAVMLAVVSAGFQAYRAATANPVDALRHE
ncbi:MAG: ABC transporter permease, partial [candidate division Zixibacteria bacterium]|nr:ABC transporter permease [candidate division Zixibacteria bacterium]